VTKYLTMQSISVRVNTPDECTCVLYRWLGFGRWVWAHAVPADEWWDSLKQRRFLMSSEYIRMQVVLGGSEMGHYRLRQHWIRYAHRLSVHHHGRMDHCPLLRTWRSCLCILYLHLYSCKQCITFLLNLLFLAFCIFTYNVREFSSRMVIIGTVNWFFFPGDFISFNSCFYALVYLTCAIFIINIR